MTTESGSVLTGTPAPAQAAAAPAAPAAQPQWHDGTDPEVTGWAKQRGYKLDDPAEAARQALVGHYNAEKLIGLDRAGRTVAIPKDDAPPAEWDAYYAKLGRPQDAKGYKLPETMRDDPTATAFLDVAHKAGYTQKQLEPVFAFVQQQSEALAQQQEQAQEMKAQAEIGDLRKEWGGEFELRSEAARRAVRELGLTPDQAGAIETALGVKAAAQVFFKIGAGLLEDKAEGIGGGNGGGGKFGLSPTEAQGRIKSLQRDADFTARLLKGDTQAKTEWDRLHGLAFGA